MMHLSIITDDRKPTAPLFSQPLAIGDFSYDVGLRRAGFVCQDSLSISSEGISYTVVLRQVSDDSTDLHASDR
jgi:hypothetical protein